MTKPVHREQQRFLEKDIQAGLATEFIRTAIQVVEAVSYTHLSF